MTKDCPMIMRDSVDRRGLLVSVALACTLGAVSIGGSCGGAGDVGSAPPPEADAGGSDSARHESASGSTTGSGTGAADVDGGVFHSGSAGGRDGGPTSPEAASKTDTTCVPAEESCTAPGAFCCEGSCTDGVCGACLAEGATCAYDGGTPPEGVAACCNGLACNQGFCGTSLCSPDSTDCTDPSVVCCNDNCNNGKCGG